MKPDRQYPCHARRAHRAALLLAIAEPVESVANETDGEAVSRTPVVEELVITGTRITNPNLVTASPVQSVSTRDVSLTGVPNLEQTLNQLPQLVPGFTNTSNNPGTGAATLDLRGLGSVRTLVLVDGRRWIADDAASVPEVDINTIPAALIKRIDVVTGGASAVYGSDAVTGVVNFILDDRLEGIRIEGGGNLTERGDGRQIHMDIVAGTAFSGGRGHVTAAVGWIDQQAVLQGARNFSAFTLGDGCALVGTRDRYGAYTSAPDDNGDCSGPNEALALTRQGSSLIPAGRIRGSTLLPGPGNTLIAYGPGITFEPDGAPRRFDFSEDFFNYAPDNYLQLPLRRWNAFLRGDVEISPAFTPYVQFSFVRTQSDQRLAPSPAIIGVGSLTTVDPLRINLTNPYLAPATREVLELSYGVDTDGDRAFVGTSQSGITRNPAFDGDADGIVTLAGQLTRRLSELGPRIGRNKRDAWIGSAGLKGRWTSDWSYDAYISHSRALHRNRLENSASALRLQQALLATSDPQTGSAICLDPSGGCVPANLFGEGKLSPEAVDFIRADADNRTVVTETVAELSVQGDLGTLPGGSVATALGVSWRRSGYSFAPDEILFTSDVIGFSPGTPAKGHTTATDAFVELHIPLATNATYAHEVAIDVGLRHSRDKGAGGDWTWKVQGVWAPLAAARLRASYQRAIRAPNVFELFAAEQRNYESVFDPCGTAFGLTEIPAVAAACVKNGVPVALLGQFDQPDDAALVRTSGSTAVRPERADTFTVGVSWLQDGAGFSVAADYYSIRLRNAIGQYGGGAAYVLAGCIFRGGDPADELCRRFGRDGEGIFTVFNLPTANLAKLKVSGIDWQAGYRTTIGAADLVIDFSGTRYLRNSFQPNTGIPAIDCAGRFGYPCGTTIVGTSLPKWKLFNSAQVEWRDASVTLRHRLFSATTDARPAQDRLFGRPAGYTLLPLDGDRLEARHYFDLAARWRQGDATLTFGINNLTDKQPALTGYQQVQANSDPSLYDVLGRRFFIDVRIRL